MTTALLVIDLQHALVEGGYRTDTVVATVADLLDRARQAVAPVIYLRHEHTGGGPLKFGTQAWQIHAAIAPQDGEVVLDKRASDSFYGTHLDDALRARGVTHVVVTGMATEQCVDTTVRSAQSHGYDVTLVADGHTTFEDADSDLTAAQKIAYHNHMLPYIPNPDHTITVVPGAAVSFAQEE